MEEIWKDVPGFEGLYQASTEGNIRSLNYNGQKGVVKNLTPVRCGEGNYRVGLFDKNKKKKIYQWSRVIALTFVPNPENKPIVSYIDKDITDNKPSNLEWSTRKEVAIKSIPDKNIIYNGKKFRTERELAEYYGISAENFCNRKLKGWTLDEILTIPVDKKNCCGKPYYYKYNGKYMTLEQISKITGIKLKTIRARISNGWDLYGACEIPVEIYKNRKVKKNETKL